MRSASDEPPMNDFYGGKRLGDNLFADSLVVFEAATEKRVWHFQFTNHRRFHR
jgi:quinoprotein glucose dehydrogenase